MAKITYEISCIRFANCSTPSFICFFLFSLTHIIFALANTITPKIRKPIAQNTNQTPL